MTEIKSFYFNDLRECCYIVWDDTKECVIIDPGCFSANEQERLAKFIEQNNLKPVKLLNTHGHFDHIMGNAFVVSKWNVPSYIHKEDKHHLVRAKQYTEMFGYKIEQPPVDTIDLEDGAEIDLIIERNNDSTILIEIKSNSTPNIHDARHVKNFKSSFQNAEAWVVSQIEVPKEEDEVRFLPFQQKKYPFSFIFS